MAESGDRGVALKGVTRAMPFIMVKEERKAF